VRWGVPLHEAWLASGAATHETYAAALANRLGVPLAGWDAAIKIEADDIEDFGRSGLPASVGGRPCRVLRADSLAPEELRAQVAELQLHGTNVALAPRFRFNAALEEYCRPQRIDEAVHGLVRRSPESSARGSVWIWQVVAAAVAAGLIVGGLSTSPEATIAVLTAIVAIPFFCITLLRLMALPELLFTRLPRSTLPAPSNDAALPHYTILVPLFQETGVLGGLAQALQAIDYPLPKLEIFLILEAADLETQAAVLSLDLPPQFRTIVVPDRAPRTKPKALNYALQFAHGDFVVVYDAEDRPQPDQLRRALDIFRQSMPQMGCVQAQLNIYNPRASWFTRQFTIEYSALFDGILPGLARLRLPVPLGGTSNHFRREALDAAGGWDPFNVTEDADLGFRLARGGWHTAMLASTTWEEAPIRFVTWFKQRTRWLKGWMQTYLVHTRRPWSLVRDVGLRGTIGIHVIMGALILSALAHPLFYLLLGYHALSGQFLTPSESLGGSVLWTVAWVNLTAGYAVSILVGALSVIRRGRPALALSALFMPLCWLLISAAAYRALYQLATDPYRWEKTTHGETATGR
jgi:glycosyltransferase XagB